MECVSTSASLDGLMVALKAVDDTQVETSDGNANPDSNTQVETKVDQGPEPKPESEQRQSFISSSSDTRNVDTPQRTIDISTLVLPAQVLCFLPWCIAVGCALLVFPKHLEQLVFSSGYYFPSSATIFSSLGSNQASAPSRTGTPTRTSGSLSPKGIHRFAHLAEYTLPHISIFFGFLFMLLYVNPPLGLGVCAVLVGQGVIAWKDFREEDVVDVALGDDDRSSVYWILKRYVVGDSCWEFSVEDCGRICMVRGGEEYFSFGEVDESEGEGEGEE
ncbi:hypothetical protein L218DRAFT_556264 [Marasmius fiardii PR-910]|nr:hypothetical protein L218DRAFT_556264 [Marasmius fiardii PR-910]